jgi:beta-glucosidase-like glycosyl hydrolase
MRYYLVDEHRCRMGTMRVEKNTTVSYAITLGALPLTESHLVYQVGKQIGLDLKSAGLHYNLAPLADINNE